MNNKAQSTVTRVARWSRWKMPKKVLVTLSVNGHGLEEDEWIARFFQATVKQALVSSGNNYLKSHDVPFLEENHNND